MRHVKIKMDVEAPARDLERSNGKRCAKCPKFQRRQNWCPILARVARPGNAACAYGIQLIKSAATIRSKQRAKERGKRGHQES